MVQKKEDRNAGVLFHNEMNSILKFYYKTWLIWVKGKENFCGKWILVDIIGEF